MAINWPKFEKQPVNESNAVGEAVNVMVEQHRAQSLANMKQLQAARAAEARRLRQESIDAARTCPPDAFNTFPPQRKE